MSVLRKILIVLEASGGGVGRHVIDLSRELARRGYEVHIIYSGLRMEEWFHRELEKLDRVKTQRIDMRRIPHPGDLVALMRIRKYISRFGSFDAIHGHSSKGGALARMASIGVGGIRVYTPHAFRTMDPLLNALPRWIYKVIERILSYITDGIILVSEDEKRHGLTLGLPPEKLFVVPNGIVAQNAISREQARQRLELKSNEVCIGFVGRLVSQKAPTTLIEAFARVSQRFPLARLVMLGDGPLSQTLHDMAEHLGVTEQIIWLKDGSGSKIMPAFDVFAMPSRYEGFPYVLIEAAAAGLPIIATPVGGTSAVLTDNVNGYLSKPDQPDMLAQALAKLLDNPALRMKMGQASKEISLSFTVDIMADRTLQVYEKLLKAGEKSAL